MGEAIAADIVTKIIEKMGSVAFKKIVYAKDLDSHIGRLQEIESMIAAALDKVDPFEVSNDIHGHKIKRLRRIHDDLVYFFEERAAQAKLKEVMMGRSKITSEVRSFLSSSNQLVLPFRIADKVNAITRGLQNIASDNALCDSIVIDSSEYQNPCTSSEDTGPFPVTDVFIGRDKDMEKVVDMIFNSDDGQVFAIVGVGGQGKTTLAQYVCIDDRVKGCFDKLLWVYVTPKSDVVEILEKIITSATGKKPTYNGREQLHHGVSQAIVGKCLLILDNVYYGENLRDDWMALRTILKQGSFWGNGGKVLITSRSRKAAEIMGTRKPYELRNLDEDDSWVLLRHYAIEQEPEEKNKSDLEKIGMEIAKMCPKVPLVLKTIGCQLAYKGSCSQWEAFRDELASNPTLYMSKQHEKIKQILKLCYDQLDNNLKRCAVFCSLFPKGYLYSRNYMVRNWIALGFLESRDGMSIEDVGDACVFELTQRAFFEDVGNFECFKMHDVMHDLMLLIGKDKHQMIDSKTKDIVEGVCHISLNINDLNWEVLLSTISSKQKLETILLVSSSWNNNGVNGVPRLRSGLDKLITSCQRLKVLEIYEQEIEKVPRSIGELTLMRHLDLSHNPLRKLPKEITKLVNLLSLNLSHCSNLQELPTEMEKLVKLRHLWVKGCNLRCMPKGFGNLTELQTLDVFVAGENSRCSSGSKSNVAAKLEELGHLKNLKGCLCIKVVGQSKYMVSSEAGKALLEMETKLTGLEIEFEKSSVEDEKLLKGVQLHGEKLKHLMVRNYGGKRLPTWMTDDQFRERFPKLSVLVLLCGELSDYMMQLTSPILAREENNWFMIKVDSNEDDLLEWVPEYSRLKEQLKIGPMGLDFRTGRSDGQLPELSHLACQSVRLRIEKELAPRLGGQRQPDLSLQSCFPNLYSMELYDIPELEVLPVEFRDLSSLVSLRIEDCPKLKAIPNWIDSLSSLQTLFIENAPELKTLPDSIVRLPALWDISLWSCPGLESLPDQISNLPGSCGLDIIECSKALFEKCGKPTGEYWPHLQHLRYLNFESSEGDEYYRPEGNQTLNVSPTTLMLQSSNDVVTHSNVLSFRNGLLLIFVLMVVMVVCLRFL